MKKAIFFYFLIVCVFGVASTARAERCLSEAEMSESSDVPDDPAREGVPQETTARYKRIMRDLNREYQQGSLTKTEYIHRKKEIDNLDL